MKIYRPTKLGILGSIVAGVLSYGCTNPQFGALYSQNERANLSVAYREDGKFFVGGSVKDDSLEVKAEMPVLDNVGDREFDFFKLNNFEFSGYVDPEKQVYKVAKRFPFHSEDNTSFYTFLNVNGSLDKSSSSTSESGINVNINTEIDNVGVGLDFVDFQGRWRAEVGYNFNKRKDDVTITDGATVDKNLFDIEAHQVYLDGEVNFDDKGRIGVLKGNVGGRGCYSFGDEKEIESTFEGELWGVYRINNELVTGLYFSSTDNEGNKGTFIFSKSNIKRKVSSIRDYLRYRKNDLDYLLNTFNSFTSSNVKDVKKGNSNYFVATIGEGYSEFGVGGEYVFPFGKERKRNIGLVYEFNVTYEDNDLRLGGLAGIISTF